MDNEQEARTALETSIREFSGLGPGWDGEEAAVPCMKAIADALVFVESMSDIGDSVATLHVDGTVIIELDGGGSFRFYGERGLRVASRNLVAAKVTDMEEDSSNAEDSPAVFLNPRQGTPS